MRNQVRRDEWTKILQDWKESGQNQRLYCAAHGIAYSTFCYWNKKLAEEVARADGLEAVRAIEVGDMLCANRMAELWPSTLPEIDTQGIVIRVPGLEATVTITGRVGLAVVGRILEACGGDAAHARA